MDRERPGLISAARLAAALPDPQLRVADATWYGAATGLNALALYRARHIPGAVFFDIDQVASRRGELPHMLPGPEVFAQAAGALGLGDGLRIVVYDQTGIASAACRLWWELRLFGHQEVLVLDGGLPAWEAAGLPLSARPAAPAAALFTPRPDYSLLKTLPEVLRNVQERQWQQVDARSAERWQGAAEEPWGEPGRIPGSLNVPYMDLIDAGSGRLLPDAALRARFAQGGVDLAAPIAVGCGSGVTACVLALALVQLGRPDAAVFDGSWAEWVRAKGTPRARGDARR